MIIVVYFKKRQFPSIKNTVFVAFLFATLFCVTFETIFASYVSLKGSVSSFVMRILVFDMLLIYTVLTSILMSYAVALLAIRPLVQIKIFKGIALFTTVFGIIMGISFFTPYLLSSQVDTFYIGGFAFPPIYGMYVLYTLLAVYLTIKYYKDTNKDNIQILFVTFISLLMALTIKYLHSSVLVMSMVLLLIIVLCYFNIQKPEDMLDVGTSAFNSNALKLFLTTRLEERKAFQIIFIDLYCLHKISRLHGIRRTQALQSEIVEFLTNLSKRAWVFRVMDYRFAVITNSEQEHEVYLDKTKELFKKPWKITGTNVTLYAKICTMTETKLSYSIDDVLNCLEFAFRNSDLFAGDIVNVNKEMLDDIKFRMAVEESIRIAISENKWLEIYLQPIYSVKEQRFASAEALIRLSHPTFGSISPAQFVPLAEQLYLAPALDAVVVNQMTDFINKYDPKNTFGLDFVHINLSALEFSNARIFKDLCNVLEKQNWDPGFVHLEITETAAIASHDVLREHMNLLRKKGFCFVLDDFGSGYANIRQILDLQFSTVKIDKSILTAAHGILEDSMSLLSRMNVSTVIEGVETKEQAERIEKLNIDYMQGFYYARPMPIPQFVAFMKKEKIRLKG